MSAAYTAVAIGTIGLYQGYQAGQRADEALGQQAAAAQGQLEISQQQLDLSTEQWQMYVDNIYPMELRAQEMGLEYQEISLQQYQDYYAPMSEQFATEAMEGVEAQPERAAREARLSVDQAFDTEEAMMQRNLERRGVRPGSGAYESGVSDTSLSRAAAKGFAVNRAVEAERDRVEDVNFNRMAVALGRTPVVGGGAPGLSPNAAAYGMAAAGSTAQGAGSQFGNIAGTYGDAAGGMASGGIQLGMQAYDLYNQYSQPSPSGGMNTGFSPTSFNSYSAPAPTGGGMDIGFSPTAFKDGGPVHAPGYADGGPVLSRGQPTGGGEVSGQPGVDQVPAYIESPDGVQYPAKLTDNEYVVPADVMKVIGTGVIEDIIEKARQRKEAGQSANALTRRIN